MLIEHAKLVCHTLTVGAHPMWVTASIAANSSSLVTVSSLSTVTFTHTVDAKTAQRTNFNQVKTALFNAVYIHKIPLKEISVVQSASIC